MLDWNDPNAMKRHQTALNADKRNKKPTDKSDYERYEDLH